MRDKISHMRRTKNKTEITPLTSRWDGWENLLTKIGVVGRDKRLSATVTAASVFAARHELEDLYHGNDLANRICSLPAVEMCRNWITLKVDDPEADPDELSSLVADVAEAVDTLRIQAKVTEALTWARLFGGAIIWIGADDGRAPDQELNLAGIRRISFATVFDRHEVQITAYYEDPEADGDLYGQPKMYEIIGTPRRIHASRVLQFNGAPTTRYRRKTLNNGWHDSVFVKLFSVIRGYDHVWDGAEALMQDFAQAVFKMKGLAEAMATNGEAAVMDRLEIMDASRSMIRALILDAEHEDFERKPTPLTGLPELLDRWLHRVSAAAEMPVTLLFGMSPGGLNATGESDTRFFYDSIKAKQEAELRPALEKFYSILLRSKEGPTGGVEPEGWSFSFDPLWQMSDVEKAGLRKTQCETDTAYINAQVLTPDEVAASRFGNGEWSAETTLDLEARELMKEAAEAAAEVTAEADQNVIKQDPKAKDPGAEIDPRKEEAKA